MLAWIVALLQLLASLCAAQTRLASFSASEAAAFKAAVVGQDLSVLGVPASLAARLPNLDPNIPAHRLLMAPVALSMQARASDIAGQARALLAEDARQAIAGAARAEAPVSELHSSKSELAALEEAAAAYEMKPMALELAQARDAVWTRIEDSVASAGGKTAQSLSDVPAPRKGILGALVRYMADDPPPPPPNNQAVRSFRRFQASDLWGRTASSTRGEIEALRRIKSKEERKAYLRGVGEKVVAKLQERFGTKTLGFHYNMHGGLGEQYVAKGILATMGDRIANRNQNPFNYDARKKVFFYKNPGENLYDILDTNRMDSWPLPLRMGSELMIFDLEDKFFVEGFANGNIGLHTRATWNMSYTFEGVPGIPYSAFVLPPVEVFPDKMPKKLGMKGRLSRDEATLAAIRVIEAAADAEERFVPKD